jgi:hypothetical protein
VLGCLGGGQADGCGVGDGCSSPSAARSHFLHSGSFSFCTKSWRSETSSLSFCSGLSYLRNYLPRPTEALTIVGKSMLELLESSYNGDHPSNEGDSGCLGGVSPGVYRYVSHF